eukprot:1155076-Pelagomonas_calceolata.AAC.6
MPLNLSPYEGGHSLARSAYIHGTTHVKNALNNMLTPCIRTTLWPATSGLEKEKGAIHLQVSQSMPACSGGEKEEVCAAPLKHWKIESGVVHVQLRE